MFKHISLHKNILSQDKITKFVSWLENILILSNLVKYKFNVSYPSIFLSLSCSISLIIISMEFTKHEWVELTFLCYSSELNIFLRAYNFFKYMYCLKQSKIYVYFFIQKRVYKYKNIKLPNVLQNWIILPPDCWVS